MMSEQATSAAGGALWPRGGSVLVSEFARAELANHAALPHSAVPNDDDLHRGLKVLDERHRCCRTSASAPTEADAPLAEM